MPPDGPSSESDVLKRAVALIAERLPPSWSSRSLETDLTDRRIDARFEVRDAAGSTATVIVEAKRIVQGRDIASIKAQLNAYAEDHPGAQGLVAARYLSPPVRQQLTAAGLSYVDATGNMRVELHSPGLFISDRGADSDPWRGPGRPRGTLKGEPAAKVVRAIADFAGPWAVRELVEVSQASTGATYRVVEFLVTEGLATRDVDGRVAVSDWVELLRRWSDDYGFMQSNDVTRWIAPRGIQGLVARMATASDDLRYAVTGSIAAAEWAAYAPARAAMVYVADAQKAALAWDVRPADAGANVLLAVPAYDVVFERSLVSADGVTVAAPTQVVVDLMTGPGRNPSEAEELLEWMQRNEQSWRN